jgi:hypothetical protein
MVSVGIGAFLLDMGLAFLSIGKSTTANLAALADCVPALLGDSRIGRRFRNVTWNKIVHMTSTVSRGECLPKHVNRAGQDSAKTIPRLILVFADHLNRLPMFNALCRTDLQACVIVTVSIRESR